MKNKFVYVLFFSLLMLVSCSAKEEEVEGEDESDYVYIIYGETKFHTRDCRYVRSNNNVDNMPKDEAIILGNDPCFVCRP